MYSEGNSPFGRSLFGGNFSWWRTSYPVGSSFHRSGLWILCLFFSEVLSGYSPSSGDRPFCVHPQFSVSQVFCPFQGFSSLEGGRTLLPVVRPSIVCLPTLLDPPLSLGGDRSGRIGHYDSEASETMISEVIYSGGTSQSSPSSEGPLSTNPCLVNHFFLWCNDIPCDPFFWLFRSSGRLPSLSIR